MTRFPEELDREEAEVVRDDVDEPDARDDVPELDVGKIGASGTLTNRDSDEVSDDVPGWLPSELDDGARLDDGVWLDDGARLDDGGTKLDEAADRVDEARLDREEVRLDREEVRLD